MKVILMHGKDTNPTQKWYPWLANEVKKRGIEFISPELPAAQDPDINEWVGQLEKTEPNKDSILVGHSRGGVAILRYLEKSPDDLKVKKVILVATNSGNSNKRNVTENNKGFFTEDGYNFEKIKSHCNDFVVLHSEDDEWVPFEAGEENATGLNAKFLKFNDRGHFGKKINFIPELLEEIINASSEANKFQHH
jgi:predicted alpha/beta hydrolase family esterase